MATGWPTVSGGRANYDHVYSYDLLGNIQSVTREGDIYNYHFDPSQPHAVTLINTPAAGEGTTPPPMPVFTLDYDTNGNMDTRTDHTAGGRVGKPQLVDPRVSGKYNLSYNGTMGYDCMGQITIYLDKETEEKMRAILQATGMSRSRWVADLIRERLQSEWPDSVIALAGAWQDFPSAKEIRAGLGQDVTREPV